jgi:hypothetical protein
MLLSPYFTDTAFLSIAWSIALHFLATLGVSGEKLGFVSGFDLRIFVF